MNLAALLIYWFLPSLLIPIIMTHCQPTLLDFRPHSQYLHAAHQTHSFVKHSYTAAQFIPDCRAHFHGCNNAASLCVCVYFTMYLCEKSAAVWSWTRNPSGDNVSDLSASLRRFKVQETVSSLVSLTESKIFPPERKNRLIRTALFTEKNKCAWEMQRRRINKLLTCMCIMWEAQQDLTEAAGKQEEIQNN